MPPTEGPTGAYVVRDATTADLKGVAAIYDIAVRDSISTFEHVPPGPAPWTKRLAHLTERDAFLVAVESDGGRMLGYAYSNQYRSRAGYLGTRETSVYLAAEARGRGIGTALYADLLDRVRAARNVVAVAVVAEPNPASVALHEHFGFTRAGLLPDVGAKFGELISTSLWTLRL